MTMRSTFPGANSSKLNFTRTISAAVIAITCVCSSYSSAQNKEPDWVNTKPSQGQNSGGEPKMQVKWKAQPFDHKTFIENKGQFNAEVGNMTKKYNEKVLYKSTLEGDVKAYFMPNGIFYRKIDFVSQDGDLFDDNHDIKKDGKEKNDPDAKKTAVVHRLGVVWENANPNATIEA